MRKKTGESGAGHTFEADKQTDQPTKTINKSSKMSNVVKTKFGIMQSVILYSLCSASLLLLNKLCMHYIPLPCFVSVCQFAFSVLGVLMMSGCKLIDTYSLELQKTKIFSIYVLSFIVGLYANMRALEVSTVETVIVFRACTPLCVSFLDYTFLGRAFPSLRSTGALLAIVCGCYFYVVSDKAFELSGLEAYTWAIIYFLALCFQMTYGKLITSQVPMDTWERVYYTNLLSILPMGLYGFFVTEEFSKYESLEITEPFYAGLFLVLSCICGLFIGWAGWNCRQLLSAASYTLVGVTNKIVTVLVNMLIWDQHANSIGVGALGMCIIGSAIYRQAP
eukprot:UN32737